MSKKIIHYRNKCIGCGTCVLSAPETWTQNDNDGLVDLRDAKKRGNVHVADLDMVNIEENKEAAEGCPTKAIIIQD